MTSRTLQRHVATPSVQDMDTHIDLEQLDLNEYFRPPKHLICPVCLDLFKQPCLLFCSHTVCKECIDGIVTNANNGIPGFDFPAGNDPDDIPCPVCRTVTKVGDDKLPTAICVGAWRRTSLATAAPPCDQMLHPQLRPSHTRAHHS